jgi:hypothetical protein
VNDKHYQQMLDELNLLCEKHGYQLINICLRDLNSKDKEGELLVINRVTLEDLSNMLKDQVKH